MTKDQLVEATQILFDTFDVKNREGKLRTLYEFFGREDFEQVKIASRKLTETSDRFPKIGEFGETLRTLKHGKALKESNVTACKWCDGDGRVSATDESGLSWCYRCCCLNASKYQNYPAWFGETHPDKRLSNYADIVQNPEVYRKGLAYLDKMGLKVPKDVRAKIEQRIGKQKEVDECPF